MAHVSLSKPLRNALQSAAMQGREIAETGAREALAFYNVGAVKAPEHLNSDQKDFRNKLRAHARQLGDLRADVGSQDISRLIDEVAYEQWHRILFTRFLIENGLLIHPELEAPLSLSDVGDLAAEEGREVWELASEFASKMLPQIFRPEDPTQLIRLPRNRVQELEKLVLGLDVQTFKADDALGWSYQFWQAKRKDAINASGVTIGADELPAVTQLFTEDYMVEFLLQNSLGAWFKSNHPNVPLDLDMPYLRWVEMDQEGEDGVITKVKMPAAGRFEKWPKSLVDFKALDPCCGSGHFPVFLLHMLVPMRMALEDLTAKEAVDVVFRDNLYGLELDPRCVEIAVFALALAAWTYPGTGGYRKLPAMNIACCGLAIAQKQKDWVALAGDDVRLQKGMEALYLAFKDAPTLGSLLDPAAVVGDLFEAGFQELEPLLTTALSGGTKSDDAQEAILVAQGLGKAARILSDKFDLVVTNPPYLGRGNQVDVLKNFCDAHYPDAKHDIANVMLSRCLQLLNPVGGVLQLVLPQNWLFLGRYAKQRKSLFQATEWRLIARLGPGAFETITGEVVQTVLLTIVNSKPAIDFLIRGIEAAKFISAIDKAEALKVQEIRAVQQVIQLSNPDNILSFDEVSSEDLLALHASALSGCSAGDAPRFNRQFWEVNKTTDGTWRFHHGTVSGTQSYGGQSEVIFWENEKGSMHSLAQSVKHLNHAAQNWLRGKPNWGKPGVVISQMGGLPTTLYTGEIYDCNACAVIPNDPADVLALWAYCESGEHSKAVRKIDQSLKVTPHNLLKVPFDRARWRKIASERFPQGLPKPYSDDPTQWLFHGHPQPSRAPLQVAVARLLGYTWPAETDEAMELSYEARQNIKRAKALMPYADTDGIVCIPSVSGEAAAADRLLTLLLAAYGDQWSHSLQSELLKTVGFEDKGLEAWLRDGYFPQHCKLFHDRPFIWHIWDGEKDGFSALVSYHKLNKQTLSTLTHTYLGGWIEEKKKQQAANIDGAKELVLAAEALQEKLKKILVGEKPCDIFVRWKPLDQQPLGWDPDLNDGVRLNIRPFLLAGDVGKKGAGILRDRPKSIKWTKDRGTDVTSASWYNLGPEYGEDKGARINEHHTTLEEKKKAREG